MKGPCFGYLSGESLGYGALGDMLVVCWKKPQTRGQDDTSKLPDLKRPFNAFGVHVQ